MAKFSEKRQILGLIFHSPISRFKAKSRVWNVKCSLHKKCWVKMPHQITLCDSLQILLDLVTLRYPQRLPAQKSLATKMFSQDTTVWPDSLQIPLDLVTLSALPSKSPGSMLEIRLSVKSKVLRYLRGTTAEWGIASKWFLPKFKRIKSLEIRYENKLL